MGGAEEHHLSSNLDGMGAVGSEGFEENRRLVRSRVEEDKKREEAAVAIQRHARGIAGRKAYYERRPKREWRFVKTHRRKVAHSGGSVVGKAAEAQAGASPSDVSDSPAAILDLDGA